MAKMKMKKSNINKIQKGTLDQKHTERLIRFKKLKESLPMKKEKLLKVKVELNELINMNPNKYSHDDIRRKAYLMDMVDKLSAEIHAIENCKESLEYISNTLPILVDYYDNNNNIIDDDGEEYIHDNSNKKNILSYFKQQTNDKTSENKEKQNDEKNNVQKISRAKLYDNYLNVIDINHRINKQNKENTCSIVGCDGQKILSQSDGCLVCNKCGDAENILMAIDKPNYKEPTQDTGTYAYKRINHLTEILSQLQAKESTDIPTKVFENILRELKKRKINKDDLDIFRLRRILKKLNYRKYYEHVPHILQIINGKEPPNFSRKNEMKIKKMFKDIQKPFSIHCPKNRKNFLNYSYVLHKFCELLDLDQYINYFPLLKNNAKLLQHDRIWKKICEHMKWKFYKSI